MASIGNIKQAAKNLRYNVATGDDPAVLQDIANQVGFYNYHYPEDNDALFSILSDEMTRKGMDKFWGEDMDGNQYDDDVFYDSENDDYVYRDEDGNEYTREEKEEKDREDGNNESDDSGESEGDSGGESNSSESDSVDSSGDNGDGSSDDSNDSSKDEEVPKEDEEAKTDEPSKEETDIQNNANEMNNGEGKDGENQVDKNGQAPESDPDAQRNENRSINPNDNGQADNPNQNANNNGAPQLEDKSRGENGLNPDGTPKKSPQDTASKPSGSDSPQLPATTNNNGVDNVGNGYNSNAVNKKKAANKAGDPTERARKTLNSDNKARAGKNAERFGKSSGKATKKTSQAGKEAAKKTGKAAKSAGKKAGAVAKDAGKKVAKGLGKAIAKLGALIARYPAVFVVLAIILFLLIIIMIAVFGGGGSSKSSGSKNGSTCTYNVSGVVGTGKVELSNIQVELVNCDASESDYTVLETIPFEKYVLGVAAAEIGPNAPDEAFKAQLIAVRNFALTRNKGMCPGNPDNCFYGYNSNTNTIRMRACEADQVYWNIDQDIYRKDEGRISKYSPEVDSSNGTLWKSKLDSETKKHITELASSVMGEVLLDSNGDVMGTSYKSTDQVQFTDEANKGKNYKEILEAKYGSSTTSTATCSSIGNIDYGDYSLSSEGDTIIDQDLASFLSSNGSSLEEFNQLISDNVDKAGYGTRAGVVAAAVTLIAELGDNYNVKVPYFWGGGHSGISTFANGTWGSTSCSTNANGLHYNRCGLDCSGFVGWAVYNGGYRNVTTTASNYYNTGGAKKVSLSSSSATLQPGDIMANSHHVVLVVGVNEEAGKYIIAHASGLEKGVLFSEWSYSYAASEYYGIDMSGFYDNTNNVREKA